MNKKGYVVAFAVVFILGILIILVVGSEKFGLDGFFSKFGIGSLLGGGNQINCVDGGTTTWDCSMAGSGTHIQGVGEKFDINILNPKSDLLTSMFLDKAKSVSSDVNEFFSTHYKVESAIGSYGIYEPFDSGWDSRIGADKRDIDGTNFGWDAVKTPISNKIYPQKIVIKGNSENGVFETYGLCKVDSRSCWAYDPFPDENIELTPTEMIIYFKEGGYIDFGVSGGDGFNIFQRFINWIKELFLRWF